MGGLLKWCGQPKLLAIIVVIAACSVLAYAYFITQGHSAPDEPKQFRVIKPDETNVKSVDNMIKEVTKQNGISSMTLGKLKSVVQPRSSSVLKSNPVSTNKISNPNLAVAAHISWEEFSKTPISEKGIERHRDLTSGPLNPAYQPIMCGSDILQKLASPRLSEEDFSWCKWAIDHNGGSVIVGKSWGKLKSKKDQQRFDALNCNAVKSGKNPSCDDSWGDLHIDQWRKSTLPEFNCPADARSRISCHANDNTDKFCTIENAQINFAKTRKVPRSGKTPSKIFEKKFLSADCGDSAPRDFPFSHLYSSHVSSQQCDYVHNGTVLMFSHDDIRNLGHTLNDIMNVWIMMWMDGVARDARSLNMLNIDSFKLGHNFDDAPNVFFLPYKKSLNSIIKGVDFGTSTLCVQKLLIQPLPPRFFIWESWFTDMPCSFIGPSSLYQRWNMHVRHSYGLLQSSEEQLTNKRMQVLLVVRNEKTNLWGSSRTSRNFLNTDEIVSGLRKAADAGNRVTPTVLVVQDLSQLSFEAQVKLIAESSIMVGAHGAGMASSMHMAVGTKYCCGMIEVGVLYRLFYLMFTLVLV